jgi:hypothetical protein
MRRYVVTILAAALVFGYPAWSAGRALKERVLDAEQRSQSLRATVRSLDAAMRADLEVIDPVARQQILDAAVDEVRLQAQALSDVARQDKAPPAEDFEHAALSYLVALDGLSRAETIAVENYCFDGPGSCVASRAVISMRAVLAGRNLVVQRGDALRGALVAVRDLAAAVNLDAADHALALSRELHTSPVTGPESLVRALGHPELRPRRRSAPPTEVRPDGCPFGDQRQVQTI